MSEAVETKVEASVDPVVTATEVAKTETPTVTKSALTGAETKTAEVKTEDAVSDSTKPVVPEKYEIKAPEGVELDMPAVESFLELAKAEGFTNDTAQKIVDFGIARQKALAEASDKMLADQVAKQEVEGLNELRKDPELGGANYEQTLEYARKGFLKFASPEEIAFIDATRLGNRVPMLKLFRKVYLAFREETSSGKGSQAQVETGSEEDFHRKMYPKMMDELSKTE